MSSTAITSGIRSGVYHRRLTRTLPSLQQGVLDSVRPKLHSNSSFTPIGAVTRLFHFILRDSLQGARVIIAGYSSLKYI